MQQTTFSRSNWFVVKDIPAFRKFVTRFGYKLSRSGPRVSFHGDRILPYGTEGDDFIDKIAWYLEGDSVAVVFEVSIADKSLSTYAVAVNRHGDTVETELNHIYTLCRSLGDANGAIP